MERAAAGTFTTLGLELGGKDPAYVAPDANLPFAVENLVDGAFFNSGQCCCGIERIYVHESRYGAFVKAYVELTSQYVLGDPLDPATHVGALISAEHMEKVLGYIARGQAEGARLLTGGRRVTEGDCVGVWLGVGLHTVFCAVSSTPA